MASPGTNSEAEKDKSSSLWPNLFVETCEMTMTSIAVFALADMRLLARKEKLLSAREEVLQLPMSGEKAFELTQNNKEELRCAKIKSSDFVDLAKKYRGLHNSQLLQRENLTVHYVGDEFSSTECVHIVATDSLKKNIILAFRGSITIKDWMQDAKTIMGSIPNPVAKLDHRQSENVGVHLGFRDYLYGDSLFLLSHAPSLPAIEIPGLGGAAGQSQKEANATEDKESGNSKEEESPSKIQIILNQLEELHHQFPDYNFYVTGHSLGGALALICAVEMAARVVTEKMDAVVSCVTVGNPMAGNPEFGRAVQYLEKLQKLRCLCVHNYLDLVPMLPDNWTKIDTFVHVGFKMNLRKSTFKIRYNRADEIVGCKCCCKCRCSDNSCKAKSLSDPATFDVRLNNHDYRLYLERLLNQKDSLSKLYLNDFYDKEVYKEKMNHGRKW